MFKSGSMKVTLAIGNRIYSSRRSVGVTFVLSPKASAIFDSQFLTMAQILDPLPSNGSEPIVCCYINATSKIQVARITNIPNWYFERVVFPGQRLMFEAPLEGQLEIHSGMMASAILSDTISCHRLQVEGGIPATFSPDHQQRLEELNNGLGTPMGEATVTQC